MELAALGVYLLAGSALVALFLVLSRALGERHRERSTGEPYESGVAVTGSTRVPVSVRFYPVAMIFVIFDLEAAFLVAWAAGARGAGAAGAAAMAAFVVLLALALAYAVRAGALGAHRRAARPR